MGIVGRLLEKWGRFHLKAEGHRWRYRAMDEIEAGQPEAALASAREALALYAAIGHTLGEARSHNVIGHALERLNRFQEAREHQERSLEMARALAEPKDEATALVGLGNALAGLGLYDEAEERFRAQAEIGRRRHDREILAAAYGNLANLERIRGHLAASAEYRRMSLELSRSRGDRAGAVQDLIGFAMVHTLAGDYGASFSVLEEALQEARAQPNRLLEAAVLANLGHLCLEVGDREGGVRHFQAGLALAREAGAATMEVELLVNLASAHLSRHDREAAGPLLREALTLARQAGYAQVESQALTNLGNLSAAALDEVGALYFYEAGLALKRQLDDRRGVSLTLTNLGILWQILGDPDRAADLFRQAAILAAEISHPVYEGMALNNLGSLLLQRQDFAGAEAALESTAGLWDSLRTSLDDRHLDKVSLLQQQGRTYILLVQALTAQERMEEALVACERGRARALVDRIATRLGARLGEEVRPPSLDDIRRIAREQDATLVEYAILTEEARWQGNWVLRTSGFQVWVVRPDGAVLSRTLPYRPPFQERQPEASPGEAATGAPLLDELRDLVAPEGPAPDVDLTPVYDLLVRPIEEWLPERTGARLVLLPHEALFLVPFAALRPDPESPPLAERFSLSLAPSIQALDLARRQWTALQGQVAGALVVGNPRMPVLPARPGAEPRPLSALPAAEREAYTVARQWGTAPLTGEEATRDEVLRRISGKKVVHLATHGILDEVGDREVPGAIALAPANGDSGLLTAAEILERDVRSELVVLSACNTGVGHLRSEGILGLAYAFLAAGVPSLLVSLWPVPDRATADLMAAFHAALAGGLDKAQALRRAMLETAPDHPHPESWAGFVLLGEAR